MNSISGKKVIIRVLAGLVAVAISLTWCVKQVLASEKNQTVFTETLADSFDRAYAYTLSVHGAIDETDLVRLCLDKAGESDADWLVNLIERMDAIGTKEQEDLFRYRAAVKQKLADENTAPMDRLRMALLLDKDEDAALIEQIALQEAYAKGIMSEIYALRLLSRLDEEKGLADELVARLCERQLEQGGWSLTNTPDVDVSAMTLTALAPYRKLCQVQIDNGLAYLTRVQLDNGGYASLGVENAESIAQVVMACLALGIDPNEEEDFIKQQSLWEALLGYQCEEGGFAHTKGGTSNAIATRQALEALLEASGYYGISGQLHAVIQPSNQAVRHLTGYQIKLVLVGIVVILVLLVLVYWILSGNRRLVTYLVTLGIGILVSAFLLLSQIDNPKEYREKLAANPGTVRTTVEIHGVNQVLMPETEVWIQENDSAYAQLLTACTLAEIPLGAQGSQTFMNIYIQSIGGLAEFDYGSASGWTYMVNGEYPKVGCAAYTLKEGDTVVWLYTTGKETP